VGNSESKVPLWEKYILTIQEAAEYFHIGEKKLRKLVEERTDADYLIMNGNRVMIKRKLFEKYLDESASV
jgi:excisionase family DNA binding protein